MEFVRICLKRVRSFIFLWIFMKYTILFRLALDLEIFKIIFSEKYRKFFHTCYNYLSF